jgi:protein-S-isoprenylcysteine O-methyltransferase Ste14
MTRAIVWLGGALFVASLAVTAWWFVVTSGEARPFGGWMAVAADALLLTIFAAHHSLFARDSVKRALGFIPAHLKRSAYVWVASVLLIAVIALWQPVGGTLYAVDGPRAFLHAALQIAGVLLIARAVSGLDPLELAGIRRARATTTPEPLQISGPYRYVRHPLYLGWMLALFGSAHMTGDRFAFAALTSLYLVIAIPWEERSLRNTFGDDYARYAARVRWRVLPFVY